MVWFVLNNDLILTAADYIVFFSVEDKAPGLTQFTVQSSIEAIQDIHKDLLIYSNSIKIQENIGQGRDAYAIGVEQ